MGIGEKVTWHCFRRKFLGFPASIEWERLWWNANRPDACWRSYGAKEKDHQLSRVYVCMMQYTLWPNDNAMILDDEWIKMEYRDQLWISKMVYIPLVMCPRLRKMMQRRSKWRLSASIHSIISFVYCKLHMYLLWSSFLHIQFCQIQNIHPCRRHYADPFVIFYTIHLDLTDDYNLNHMCQSTWTWYKTCVMPF